MTSFGHAWRAAFPLDPDVVYLNHGTVGVAPREVLDAQHALQWELERNPARTVLRDLPERLRAAAGRVGRFLGARGDDVVFVDNVSTAVSGVLRSLPLQRGDRVAITSLAYGAVSEAARVMAEHRGLELHEIALPFPVAHPDDVVTAFADGLPEGARLAIVEHVTANTALVLPVAEIAAVCRERGTLLLVDGAHAPGSVSLDIEAIGADLYTGNLHKWMWTPRSSGILWAHPSLQVHVRPAVISWGYRQSFTAAFDRVGTRDPSPHLAALAAIDMLERLGPEAVRTYNHDLVWAGGTLLAQRWGAEPAAPASMVGTMMPVFLPEPLGASREAVYVLLTDLHEAGFEVHGATDGTRAWLRVAAQIYNELGDFERLAERLLDHPAIKSAAAR